MIIIKFLVKFKLSGEVTPTKILLSLEDILFIDSGFTIYSPEIDVPGI